MGHSWSRGRSRTAESMDQSWTNLPASEDASAGGEARDLPGLTAGSTTTSSYASRPARPLGGAVWCGGRESIWQHSAGFELRAAGGPSAPRLVSAVRRESRGCGCWDDRDGATLGLFGAEAWEQSEAEACDGDVHDHQRQDGGGGRRVGVGVSYPDRDVRDERQHEGERRDAPERTNRLLGDSVQQPACRPRRARRAR